MNPYGIVVNENTNGIVTVNGHSYDSPDLRTENTNFALLVAKHFSEPFKDSNGYGESIARLSNMLGGGVIVQRFGDLVRGRRSNQKRIEEGLVTPTLSATPGDLSLVLPKRILDGIIEMIYALDKIAPGTANDDTLLYGVEVKFYNMEVELDENLQSRYPGLYIIGDGSGVTHSLSHASASGVYVARHILESEGKLFDHNIYSSLSGGKGTDPGAFFEKDMTQNHFRYFRMKTIKYRLSLPGHPPLRRPRRWQSVRPEKNRIAGIF